jgi:hypothetical protein
MKKLTAIVDFAIVGYTVIYDEWESSFIPRKGDYMNISDYRPQIQSILEDYKHGHKFVIGYHWVVDHIRFAYNHNTIHISLAPPDYLDKMKDKGEYTSLELEDIIGSLEAKQ